MIGTVRELIGQVEAQDGVSDWRARLGCPRYRNQVDNAVNGEATCGATTTAMIWERLGISRADVIAGIGRAVAARQGEDVSAAGPRSAEVLEAEAAELVAKWPALGLYNAHRPGIDAQGLLAEGSMEDQAEERLPPPTTTTRPSPPTTGAVASRSKRPSWRT